MQFEIQDTLEESAFHAVTSTMVFEYRQHARAAAGATAGTSERHVSQALSNDPSASYQVE